VGDEVHCIARGRQAYGGEKLGAKGAALAEEGNRARGQDGQNVSAATIKVGA